MDLRAVRFVLTLAEELHFGRAARRHYISAQAFGQQVARLEKELGARLFDRTSRTVRLTAAGERYVVHARSALAAVDDLRAVARTETRADDPVVVGVLGFGLADQWSPLRRLVTRQHPELTIGHRDLDLSSQYESVRSADVDVALIQYVGPVDGLRFDEVVSVPRVAVVPVWSELAGASRLSERDLDGMPWVRVAGSCPPGLTDWMGPASESGRSAPTVRDPASIATAVATTGALGLHGEPAGRYFAHPDVRYIPMEGEPCRIAVASRRSDERPAVASFRRAAELVATLGTADDVKT